VRLNQVFDDPEECLQRLRARIDQADTEDGGWYNSRSLLQSVQNQFVELPLPSFQFG
jgi:hypothetical protein